MLDAYRVLTKAVAANVSVPYIDMRAAFLADIPAWWLLPSGWVTVDGEHPNGASVAAAGQAASACRGDGRPTRPRRRSPALSFARETTRCPPPTLASLLADRGTAIEAALFATQVNAWLLDGA